VFVAGAHGAPPPAAAFAAGKIRTLCFDGSESGFDAFLRSEQIEVVNYHHSSFAAGCAKSQRIATVYTMHNCYLWMDAEARRRVATGLAGIDRLVAVSRQVAQFANAQFDFPADRIVVIPNGLRDDILNVAPLRAATSPGSPFTVAMVGSFTPLKLQHVAVAAFTEVAREIPDMRLRLIGSPADDAYGAQLRSQIVASPQAHRIELKVGLTRWDAIAELAAAHVFILPSLVEGCSMALLEAVAAGCVCIASDVGAARDLQSADGAILLLPSPLGELDAVDQQQFFAAAASDLPQHRENLAEKMRTAWREYGSLAAGVSQTRARLLDLHGMAGMTDAYLDAYTMAYRGGTCAPHAATTERQTAAGARSVVITAG
jgi:glycosyltransferase involved in cell wall biosynthesis